MQIIKRSYFSKENYLHVPLAVVEPTGLATPNNVTLLDSLCVLTEKDVLLNAFGLVLYKLIFALTDVTIEDPVNERFKKLISGDEYDDKIWEGLSNEYSLLAYRIYESFVTETNIRLSATGATKVDAEKAKEKTPAYLIATANQRFMKAYQGEMSDHPYRYENFTDYYGGCGDSVEKSLYQYMLDKQEDFPEWKPSMFKFYGSDDRKNSFGI